LKNLSTSKIYLITGAAGFIGFYLAKKLLSSGCCVVGIDNINDYYDINLKYARLEKLKLFEGFSFIKGDIADAKTVMQLFAEYAPDIVINMAAQAGVQYSITNPDAYMQSNVIGFYNILEACRHKRVEHLVYASSSSVYGANKELPFAETACVDYPISLYASTKKSNELMAYTYSHLYHIPVTGLRFFTVYGPMGRPDMAYFSFTDKYINNEAIPILNNGDFEHDILRDFTYIDDVVEGIVRVLSNSPAIVETVSSNIYNIGNNKPEKLMVFISTLEQCLSNSLGRKVIFEKKFAPVKPGDVPATYAKMELMEKTFGFKPQTSIKEGLQKFTDWYVGYYCVR